MQTQPETTSTTVSAPAAQTVGAPQPQLGDAVFYGIHGRCTIAAIEARNVGGRSMAFFKIEPQRAVPVRPGRHDSAIWLPVETAAQSGLRPVLSAAEVEKVYESLGGSECAFHLKAPWHRVQPQIEAALRSEGPVALAKAEGYLHLVKQRDLVPPRNLVKFAELIHRLLVRELVAATQESPKSIEEKVERLLRQKLRYET
jgi:RNA polymerase-interacting CarD/CdnL/TRCF family regulator